MRLFELFDNLLEYDHQITLTKQGPKLKAAYDKNEFDSSLAGGEVESSEILTRLEQMDPTVNKMYMLWIVRQYMNGKMRLEDYPQVFGGLEAFHKAKPRLPIEQRDINRFGLPQLYKLVDSFSDTQDPSNDTKLNRDDVEVIYNGPLGTIAIPKTEEASCELGSGTQWCTAGKQHNQFNAYGGQHGNLIIFQEPGGEKYQFHGKPGVKPLDQQEGGWTDREYRNLPEQYSLFMSGFDDGINSEWILEEISVATIADSHDVYLEMEEIKELYTKNPVLQKYLPLPKIDSGAIEEHFKQFIKDYWMAEDNDLLPRKISFHINAYEKYFGPYKLERDINFEKQVLEGPLNSIKSYFNTGDLNFRHSNPSIDSGLARIDKGTKPWEQPGYPANSNYIFERNVGVMLGSGWYMEATGMETWPELEKAVLEALKLWDSMFPKNLADAYQNLNMAGHWWRDSPVSWELIPKMPSVLNYLKSIGLSKAA